MEQETATPSAQGATCANCGAPLYGDYCYHCGQPVKGLVRHLSGVLGDVFDTVLNIDSRVLRTLPALFLRPGYLSREYFAGRRMRYVTPFRLMFFLCLLAFFVMQVAFDNATATSTFGTVKVVDLRRSGIEQARTPEEIDAQEKQALAKIDQAEAKPGLPAFARKTLEMARRQVRSDAASRLAELNAMDKARRPAAAGGTAAPASSAGQASRAQARDNTDSDDVPGGDTWDLPRDSFHVAWLPAFANNWLNTAGQRMHDNVVALKRGSQASRRAALQRMFAGVFSVLPQTMFVLLPLFAVILKIFYLFKRRLYMEHLIVALHSHAFIFLSLLVLFALAALKAWLLPLAAWLGVPFGLLTAAVWIWIFVYLWLMQKRVYAQGWFFTTLKYGCVGICYTGLLSVALALAFVMSLTRT